MITAGFSKVCISPAVGAPLAGFAARQGVCAGIHDDLYARSLVLENGQQNVALVGVDLLALSSDFVRSVRQRISKRTPIHADSILIASTHTHAGPVTVQTFFNPGESLDEAYMSSLAAAIVESVSTAWESRFAARAGVGSACVSGIGVNRRTPDKRPVDEEVGIIRIDDRNGVTRGVLVNYSCHPTVLGSDNLLATGDFPYFAVEAIENEIGDGGFAMFVNGTQGNISMGHSSELSAIGVITPGRTFEHAEELGQKLASAAIAELPKIQTSKSPELRVATREAGFPIKPLPPIETAAGELEQSDKRLRELSSNGASTEEVMKAKSSRLYASITDFYAREMSVHKDGRLPVELQGLRIGDAFFLAVPAEIFVEIGLGIKERASHKAFIIGIANGYIGYLPTKTAFNMGGYEVVSSKVAPESESLLYEKARELETVLFE
ncbi:MAG: neutral/alkaline non-lysosomal ceramidase N-terminal domain-containing protein [Acidobacteriota bacterium]